MQIVEQFLTKNKEFEEDLKDYKERKESHRDWVEAKVIKDVEVGMKLDVRTPEHIWCKGIIKRIFHRYEAKTKTLIIHYKGFSNHYDEEIAETSPRLAPAGFFTDKPCKF